jgi:farnesol kinase
MLPGVLPFVLAAVPHPDPLDTVSLGVVTAICVVLTTVFLLLHRFVRRPGEHNFLSTTLSYPGTILLTLLLFPDHAEFAGVVVTILALGDGSAYLVGKRFGKQRLPWNTEKSWLGSIAFVAVSAPIATLAYWLEAANPTVPLAMAAVCGFSAAFAGAIAESLPSRITDNLRVGLAASLAVVATHFTVAGWFVL